MMWFVTTIRSVWHGQYGSKSDIQGNPGPHDLMENFVLRSKFDGVQCQSVLGKICMSAIQIRIKILRMPLL